MKETIGKERAKNGHFIHCAHIMTYVSPFCRQGYKYNFAELLEEYLYWSPHKTVKAFFEEKYGTYNSYIRTWTKGRHSLKVYIIYQEFGLGRKKKIESILTSGFEPGEKFRDPASIMSIMNISAPPCIRRRRYIKRTKQEFYDNVYITSKLLEGENGEQVLDAYFSILIDTGKMRKFMDIQRRHTTQSLPRYSDDYRTEAHSRRSRFRTLNGY